MATFSDFKDEINTHIPTHDQWVNNSTPTDTIYWKLLYSNSGYSKKIANYPDTNEIKTSLIRLSSIVSILSKESGFKIHINSGYRNDAVNSAVGGSKTSQHSKGQAVDMDCNSMSKVDKAKLFLFILNHKNWKNKFDQIIWENNGAWVHCSFNVKSDNVASDSSYSPRPYSNTTKVYWMNPSGKYINIWTGQYKRETENGYVFFQNVPGLEGVKYDGKSFDVDYTQVTLAAGSDVGGGSYSGGGYGGYGSPLETNYGGSADRGSNKVTNLSKARKRAKGTDPNVDDTRKKDFDALAHKLIEETPNLGREINKSQEMYDPSILKGDQVSKKKMK